VNKVWQDLRVSKEPKVILAQLVKMGRMAHKDPLVLREHKAQQENHCCQVQGLLMTASETMAIHTSTKPQETSIKRSQVFGFLQGIIWQDPRDHKVQKGLKVSKVLLAPQDQRETLELKAHKV
jgi:hypothetical protein